MLSARMALQRRLKNVTINLQAIRMTFKKNISTWSLTMTGLTTIIGSGWLLGTQKIAALAGPASIIAWLMGALIAIMVGLFYIEVAMHHPSGGGIGYYATVTHGRLCGFLTSWINWLSIIPVVPIEAQSVVQYLSHLSPAFNALYAVNQHELTNLGVICAIGLMLIFMIINYWSVQLFLKFNNVLTLIKIIIPILTIICLFSHGFHSGNFGHSSATFMPFGWSSVWMSMVTCGVVMSFNGFQSPMNFSEEISNPRRALPIACLGSIVMALLLYILLQTVFIGSLPPAWVSTPEAWHALNFSSPYIRLLELADFQLMIMVVYAGAFVSPSACGAAFLASGSRILYTLANNGFLPKKLASLHPTYHNPRHAIIACSLLGCIFLLMFRGWYHLVAVISTLHVLSYVPAPIIAAAYRIQHQKTTAWRLPFIHLLAPSLLFILSILLFYAGWDLMKHLMFLMIPGILCYIVSERYRLWKTSRADGLGAMWLIVYLAGLNLITWLGNGYAVHRMCYIGLAALSCVVYGLGKYFFIQNGCSTK
jgi:amino acid transporter